MNIEIFNKNSIFDVKIVQSYRIILELKMFHKFIAQRFLHRFRMILRIQMSLE